MDRLFTTQEVLESWNKSCKVNDDVDQEAKDIVREALELKIAEEQGLLLRLPCKVGDTVYILAGRFGTFYEEDICDGFYIGRDGILQVKVQNHKGNHGTYGVVGKTVFFTKEEAEQKLASMQEG